MSADLTVDDLERLLSTLQKYGVRRYRSGALMIDLGPDPIGPPGASGEQPITEAALKKERAEMEERLLYAASEGMP